MDSSPVSWTTTRPSRAHPFWPSTQAFPSAYTCSGKPVVRNGKQIDYDELHLSFCPSAATCSKTNAPLYVHICGTGCSPVATPSTMLLDVAISNGLPCIALSYVWINFADKERNSVLTAGSESAEHCQKLLKEAHEAALFGGSVELLDYRVPSDQSILSRLKYLLLHLSKVSDRRERLVWKQYLSNQSNRAELLFDRIIVSGHSQGSGHTCYLSQRMKLRRAILISGPQEDIPMDESGAVSWLEGPFLTTDIRCFRHAEEEGTAELIHSNWCRIGPLNDVKLLDVSSVSDLNETRQLSCQKLDWSYPTKANCWKLSIDELLSVHCSEISNSSSSTSQFIGNNFRLFVSHLSPSNSDQSPRPNHNSTVMDKHTPKIELAQDTDDGGSHSSHKADVDQTLVPVYSLTIWRWVMNDLNVNDHGPRYSIWNISGCIYS